MRPPEKLYKIGEVIRYSKLGRQTIHYYTMLGLISEHSRTEAGHRLYGEEVFDVLARIKDLKKQGHTLKEIGKILRESS